ncbi:hypothetical protein JW905_19195 [bacterium]|nr:hypothetical protein [candidate division CSSED10-310 bacterium]
MTHFRTFAALLVVFVVVFSAGAQAFPSFADNMLVRVYLDQPWYDLPQLAALHLDRAGQSIRENWIDFVVNDEEYTAITAMGYLVEILRTAGDRAVDQNYKTPAEISTILHGYATMYPDLTKLESIGYSIENRDIWALKISDNADQNEDELRILFTGAHHAREVMSMEVPLDIIAWLLENYAGNPAAHEWVDNYETWVVPLVNPDGVNYVWTTYDMWRKNRRNNGGSYGVDLNRNYPLAWGSCNGSSGWGIMDDYRGPAPCSEPEVQALLNFVDGRNFVFSICYHSYSELVIYPYGCNNQYTPDHTVIAQIGQDMAAGMRRDDGGYGYEPGMGWETLYSTDGDSDTTLYGHHGIFAYTVEVNASTFHPAWTMRDPTCEGNRHGWQHLYSRMSGPGVTGHVYDACSGEPMSAIVLLDDRSFTYGESARRSEALHGRYHWITTPGVHNLTISKVGYETQTIIFNTVSQMAEYDVPLMPLNARGLMVNSFSIDDSAGDGDGAADPGEHVQLEILVQAMGGDVTGITATVTCSDPYATITGGQIEYPDIPNGQSRSCSGAAPTVNIDAGCPEGRVVEVEITFAADVSLCNDSDALAFEVTSYQCPIFAERLDNDPGWSITGGEWAFGQPTGQGGAQGNADPAGGHSGNYVYGTNLNGDYANNCDCALITEPFDCSYLDHAELRFWRWLNVEAPAHDHARVEIDGGDGWQTIWQNAGAVTDAAWTQEVLDVSQWADHSPAVRFKFSLVSDATDAYSGWNIDDLELCGFGGAATPTPSPSPTPPPTDITVGIETNQAYYFSGDPFILTLSVANHGPATTVQQYVILDVFGMYWFHDDWSSEPDSTIRSLQAGASWQDTILDFTWPAGAGTADDVRFWAAMLIPDTSTLASNIDYCDFGWR